MIIKTITIERAASPVGWFLVEMHNETGEAYAAAWESAEVALADADDLKRTYRPAMIIDRTGGAI